MWLVAQAEGVSLRRFRGIATSLFRAQGELCTGALPNPEHRERGLLIQAPSREGTQIVRESEEIAAFRGQIMRGRKDREPFVLMLISARRKQIAQTLKSRDLKGT